MEATTQARSPEPTQDKTREIAQRFARLPAPKQKAFLAMLAEQQIDFAHLPIVQAPATQPRLASYVQARQWFLWQLDPHSTAYHLSGALRLQGTLDVAALRASLHALVARHASLRTVFREDAQGKVEPVVSASAPPDLVQLEAADLAAARDAAQRISHAPFDLARGPLLRVGLVRIAAGDHVLVLVVHHIVADGASLRIVLDELVAQYAAQVAGQALSLPGLPIEYTDYAAWQRHWLEAGERERQLAYWTAHVAGDDRGQQVLQLPVDHARRSDGRYTAQHLDVTLPAGLVTALRQRARAEGATLFMVLLAGYQALLHRYTGQRELRVGAPIANRHRPETAGLVGYFANTQVLRVAVEPRSTLRQLLAQTREAALGAQTWQDLPFEHLVEALQPGRLLGTNPLFQVLFNHQRGDAASLTGLAGLSLEEVDLGGQSAQLELALETVEDASGQVQMSWRYAAELFDRATVQRMARHCEALLQALADTPAQAVADVLLLDEGERAQLAGLGTNPERFGDLPAVHRLIEQQAARQPDAVAVVFGEQSLSYGELDRRANQLAHRLIGFGVQPETVVGITVARSLDMMVGLLAILKAGGAYLPLDPEYPQDRLAYMVRASGTRLLLAQAHQQDLVRHLKEAASAAGPDVVLDVVHVDAPDVGNAASNPQVDLQGQHLAYVIYTSGSTGRPKGVMVRHEAWSHLMASMNRRPGLVATDVLLALSSLSFDMASLELYWPLVSGARLVLAPQGAARDAQLIGRLIRTHGVTLLQSTPSGWRLLEPELRAQGLPTGLKAICGGEALHPDLALSLGALGIDLWNLYGPTEATVWVTADRVVPSIQFGSPIPGTQLHVLDAGLQAAPLGVAGELYLGGVGLARGYLGRAGLTAERFVANPFGGAGQGERLYRTGDLVRRRGDGTLEYLGRTDHQVKLRGFRIELGEIETVLLDQPEVREAVVVAQDARLVAYVSPQPGQSLDTTRLKDRLADALPDYMVPARLVLLDALPLNPNGKVDRAALPSPEGPAAADHLAPEGDAEQQLAAIWAEVLGLERIGRDDNFFEIGGHSLLAAQVASRVRVARGVELPLRSLFEYPVLRSLAQHLDRLPGNATRGRGAAAGATHRRDALVAVAAAPVAGGPPVRCRRQRRPRGLQRRRGPAPARRAGHGCRSGDARSDRAAARSLADLLPRERRGRAGGRDRRRQPPGGAAAGPVSPAGRTARRRARGGRPRGVREPRQHRVRPDARADLRGHAAAPGTRRTRAAAVRAPHRLRRLVGGRVRARLHGALRRSCAKGAACAMPRSRPCRCSTPTTPSGSTASWRRLGPRARRSGATGCRRCRPSPRCRPTSRGPGWRPRPARWCNSRCRAG